MFETDLFRDEIYFLAESRFSMSDYEEFSFSLMPGELIWFKLRLNFKNPCWSKSPEKEFLVCLKLDLFDLDSIEPAPPMSSKGFLYTLSPEVNELLSSIMEFLAFICC